MNEYVYPNERKCGLYIDLLMTVRYSHEAWGRVVFAEEDASVQRKNDSVLMTKGEFKLASNPNPARCGVATARAHVW